MKKGIEVEIMNNSKNNNNKSKNKSLLNAFMTFLQDFSEEFKEDIKSELMIELDSKVLPPKLFYSLKEVSHITGLSVRAIKGRYGRGTLDVVYEATTPLIPATEVSMLVDKLNRQRLNKKAA